MTYPPPPWQTYGRAVAQPFLVDTHSLSLPPGFEPVSVAGRSIGVLAFIEYEAPSPLAYSELVWMPCMVRVTSGDRVHRGYYVEKMYVDSDASLEAGRTEWALPKQKAHFAITSAGVTVETEDRGLLVLQLGERGPSMRTPIASTTLQDAGDHVVRFHGSGAGFTGSGYLRITSASGVDGWSGFANARRLPALGVALREFEITMNAPRRIEHSLS